MSNGTYVGTELELFARAHGWKSYYGSMIARYIHGDVLEVGAGIGGTTTVLFTPKVRSWLCLEPDAALATQLESATERLGGETSPSVRVGYLEDLPANMLFDCILYIDVLEHIRDDREQLAHAAEHLRPGGRIVVLSPAHEFLFSEFDRQIGHFRRYNRRSLAAAKPPGVAEESWFYLDSVGTILSLANRLLLRSDQPTVGQIRLWDRCVIPISRLIDPLLGHRVGKSIVMVWRLSD